MEKRSYYSQRTGNPRSLKYTLETFLQVFYKVYCKLRNEGYFQKYLGIECTDGYEEGKLGDVGLEILLKLKKDYLWEIHVKYLQYSEEDLFDMIEFLHDHCSMGLSGNHHGWNGCGTHFNVFDDEKGRKKFRETMNVLLEDYGNGYEINNNGEILQLVEQGFKGLLEAAVLTDDDENINSRVQKAILKYRRAKSTDEDRKDAVRELGDILEFLKQDVHEYLDHKDEKDLYNIINNFDLRHHNASQKKNYDKVIWHSWMFYFYLATIQAVTRLKKKALKNIKK